MARRLQDAKAFVARLTGHEFKNDNILLEAIDTTGLRNYQSNQRLALLGDKIMAFIVTDTWYPSKASKGTGDNLIKDVCGNDNLANVALSIGLDAIIITNPGHFGAVGRKTLATTMEAIIGAIYVDGGKNIEAAKAAMIAMGLNMPSSDETHAFAVFLVQDKSLRHVFDMFS